MKPLTMQTPIQVISREIAKPSSQIHPQQTNLKLSYIDKLLGHMYVPLIFFFKGDESRGLTTSNHLQISQRLKESLLATLPSFYPIAGVLKNNNFLDCKDPSFDFIEARIHANLEDSIHKDEQLKQFLPRECTAFDYKKGPRPTLVVQITLFDCGGLVVGFSLSHAVGDLVSSLAVLRSWAAAFRGGVEAAPPRLSFGTASHFPTLGLVPFNMLRKYVVPNEDYMTKRFVFDKEKLETLRQGVRVGIENPSRVELVSGFIWKHFMAARLGKGNTRRMYGAVHVVNLRPRISPPGILENVFGNCVMLAVAFAAQYSSVEDIRLHELVGALRSSIRRVRDGYITNPFNKESFMKDLVKLVLLLMMDKMECCYFTSWRGFPSYELDFGWGKPAWFTTPSMVWKNLVILDNSKNGEDVEVMVTMLPHDLQVLEAQINLISTKV